MRNIYISVFLLLFISTINLSASESSKVRNQNLLDNTIKSLMIGLNSENFGLKTSSAYMIGELEIKSAVIPLMRMLRSDTSDEGKIVAALALYKLGTPMSVHALLQASRFDDSDRVRRICSGFYLDFISKQKVTKI